MGALHTTPEATLPPEILLTIARGILVIDPPTACQLASVSRHLQWIVFEAAKSDWIRRSELQILYEPNCRHSLATEKEHSIPATVYSANDTGTFSLYFTYPQESSNMLLQQILTKFKNEDREAQADFELLRNIFAHLPHLDMDDADSKSVCLATIQMVSNKLFSYLRRPYACPKRWIPGVFRHPTRSGLRIRYPCSRDSRKFIHTYGALGNGSRQAFCETEEYWTKTGSGRWEIIGFWCHDLSLPKVVSLLRRPDNPPLYQSLDYAVHRARLMSLL